jgi:hypothetical protein
MAKHTAHSVTDIELAAAARLEYVKDLILLTCLSCMWLYKPIVTGPAHI